MQNYPYYQYDQNRGFWVPLILGGLGGAAIVGASRPRPVYVNQQNVESYVQRVHQPQTRVIVNGNMKKVVSPAIPARYGV